LALRFPFSETAVVAHRGAHCCGRQENSLSAVAHAVELGVPGIEVDVCNLGDGELVLSHDPYICVGGAAVPLPELTAADLAPLLRTGEVVLAQSALDLVRCTDAFLCFDWKGYGDEARVVGLIDEFGLRERTIVSSSRASALATIKDEGPGLLTGLSVSGPPVPDDEARSEQARQVAGRMQAARADAAMLELNLATPPVLSGLRDHGAGVFVWTAKDTDTCAALIELAPDGIMSDALQDHLSLLS
jgi:glycerophosphoryl diester phosphodiesterase